MLADDTARLVSLDPQAVDVCFHLLQRVIPLRDLDEDLAAARAESIEFRPHGPFRLRVEDEIAQAAALVIQRKTDGRSISRRHLQPERISGVTLHVPKRAVQVLLLHAQFGIQHADAAGARPRDGEGRVDTACRVQHKCRERRGCIPAMIVCVRVH